MSSDTPKIQGYRELSESDLAMINQVKAAEAVVGGLWRRVRDIPDVDPRWMSVAKTHFQEGFTALVRAVAQPEDVF